MPFIYAKNKTRACQQCKNSDEEGPCNLDPLFTIKTIRVKRGQDNTYNCEGFDPIKEPIKFSLYPRF